VEQALTATNAATVVFAEDAPYNVLSSVIFKDVGGEIINCSGWELKQLTRYGGWEGYNLENSTDTNVWSKTSGVGAGVGGSYNFHLKVPISRDRRTLLGILGNQDRAQSYSIRHNIAPASTVYTTPPTNPAAITITRFYESYAVPNATDDRGVPNQVAPSTYGTILYISKLTAEATPQGGSQVVHFIKRLGFTIRCLMLVFRSNGTRANAESNLPTNIQLKVGNQTIFNESAAYRRQEMYRRYGWDAPQGVLVYDMLHDFQNTSNDGGEFGHDYLNTENVNLFQFFTTYPAGFGSTNNSLTFVTSDMVIPDNTSIYAD
jgi:hypothetical protein